MAGNQQKVPIVTSLNRFVSDKVEDIGSLVGKRLPATILAANENNTIVTVNFEVLTALKIPIIQCPVGFPEYIRFPWTKGDPGFVTAVDAYMGGMSGLGGGTATLAQQPNLSTLVWFPCGNKNYSVADNLKQVLIYGPEGVTLRDADSKSVLNVGKDSIEMTRGKGSFLMTDDSIQMVYGAHSITIDKDGVNLDGVSFTLHEHSGVQTGADNTGPVVLPP